MTKKEYTEGLELALAMEEELNRQLKHQNMRLQKVLSNVRAGQEIEEALWNAKTK